VFCILKNICLADYYLKSVWFKDSLAIMSFKSHWLMNIVKPKV